MKTKKLVKEIVKKKKNANLKLHLIINFSFNCVNDFCLFDI